MCMLLDRRDLTINLDNNRGDTPLHLAACSGNIMSRPCRSQPHCGSFAGGCQVTVRQGLAPRRNL